MEGFLPLSFPALGQSLRRGKAHHKAPARLRSPVIEGLQSRGIIFLECSLQLIDQRGALFDQSDFIAAKKPQFTDQRIVGL